MVILFKSYGDHSNRLFQNMWIEAYCLGKGLDFQNPTFSDISDYYVNPVSSKMDITAFLLKITFLKLILKKLSILKIVSIRTKSSYDDILLNAFSRNIYVEGWTSPDADIIKPYKELLVEKYSLKESFYMKNSMYLDILSVNKIDYALVAIHIRRGDYKTFRDGIYYYNDEDYENFMKQMKISIQNSDGKKCIFIIFSTENTSFEKSETLWISHNSWFVDHFLMGKCDYIIGPPSTFSIWASFIGEAKYFHINKLDQKIELKKFKSADI